MLALADAVMIVEKLAARTAAAGQQLDRTVILVGGTALAAHGVRAFSEDVDLYTRAFSADVVAAIEEEERRARGPAFKLDVTVGENLWGSILIRDIAADARTVVKTFSVGGQTYEIRALGLETLFLLKLAAGREHDLTDLKLLAAHTNADKLIDRFNVLVQWHGDRHALPAFADAFVSSLESLFGAPVTVIDRLRLPAYVLTMLREARGP